MHRSECLARAGARRGGFLLSDFPSEPGRTAQRHPLRRPVLLLAALAAFLAAGNAWAFEAVRAPVAGKGAGAAPAVPQWAATTTSPSSVPGAADDRCLRFIKDRHIDFDSSAMDRNRRSAGDAAGAGLVFGIRFALGPKETGKAAARKAAPPRLDIWQPGVKADPQALAVAEYRRCRSDEALKALGDDWRWSR